MIKQVSFTAIVIVLCYLLFTSSLFDDKKSEIKEIKELFRPDRKEILDDYKERAGARRDIAVEKEKQNIIEERNLIIIDTTDYAMFRLTFDKVIKQNTLLYGVDTKSKFNTAIVHYLSTDGGNKELAGVAIPPDITDQDKFMAYYKPLHKLTSKDIYDVFNNRSEQDRKVFP